MLEVSPFQGESTAATTGICAVMMVLTRGRHPKRCLIAGTRDHTAQLLGSCMPGCNFDALLALGENFLCPLTFAMGMTFGTSLPVFTLLTLHPETKFPFKTGADWKHTHIPAHFYSWLRSSSPPDISHFRLQRP